MSWGSGCGSVGRTVAYDTRGPLFESSHRHTLIIIKKLSQKNLKQSSGENLLHKPELQKHRGPLGLKHMLKRERDIVFVFVCSRWESEKERERFWRRARSRSIFPIPNFFFQKYDHSNNNNKSSSNKNWSRAVVVAQLLERFVVRIQSSEDFYIGHLIV